MLENQCVETGKEIKGVGLNPLEERRIIMRKLFAMGCIVLLQVALLAFFGNSQEAEAKAISINHVAFMPIKAFDVMEFKQLFIDRINERAKGELIIILRGGPEIVPSYEQALAVQKGTIQLGTIPSAFFGNIVPGADATRLSEVTPFEERANGADELIRKQFEKSGFYYLGRKEHQDSAFFYMFLNKKVEKPADFRGLKIGGSPSFHAFIRGLGATVVGVTPAEYYSAMERGVVDGLCTMMSAWAVTGLTEATKYVIDHPFYVPTPLVVVNLGTWQKIPAHLQDLMKEALIETQRAWPQLVRNLNAGIRKKTEAAGVKYVKFLPKDAQWYLDTAYNEAWKEAEKDVPGDFIPKLKELIRKQ
jgi:TRAP-type C4-dicarboxylate transport system substrate-binding protein